VANMETRGNYRKLEIILPVGFSLVVLIKTA
jgi:hypothetical protein